MPDPAPGVEGGGTPTGVVAFHGTYVATGSVWASCCAAGDPSANRGVVWTSSDGHSWSMSDRIPAFEHASLTGLVTDGTRLIALGSYAAPIPNEPGVSVPAAWVSSDGRTWVRALGPAPSYVAVGPRGFIGAVVNRDPGFVGSAQFVTSTDGLTWTKVSAVFQAEVQGLAAAPDGSAMAVGAVPGGPRTGGGATTDMVVWRSADGSSWTGPETIAHDALPGAVTSDGHGFLAVVHLSALLASGSISYVSRVWRFVGGDGPQATTIPLGDEEGLTAVFVVGDTLLAVGDTLVANNVTPTPGPDGRIIYLVKAGETCTQISLLYGVTVEYIRTTNLLDENCTLRAGQPRARDHMGEEPLRRQHKNATASAPAPTAGAGPGDKH